MPPPLTFFPPAAPRAASAVPSGPDLIAEVKLDGWRCVIIKNDKRVRFYSRKGHNLTPRLPHMHEAFMRLPSKRLMLDCELVALNAAGTIDFNGISHAMSAAPELLHLFAFDIMHQGAANLAVKPLRDRQARLDRLIAKAELPFLHAVTRHHDGEALLAACARMDLEGVVVKHLAKPYVSGPCHHWVKVKTPAWKEANKDRWRRFKA